MLEKSSLFTEIQRPTFTLQWALLLLLAGLFGLCGCDANPKPPTPSTETSAASRPPLKVWIVDAPELEKEIAVRWQASSDQPLKIECLSIRDAMDRAPFIADVVIYPGTLLGDFIKQDRISKLPEEAVAKRDAESSLNAVSLTWPIRWRNIVSFGGQLYAVPLGATNLGIVQSGLDSAPLEALHKMVVEGKDLKNQPLEQWNLFLTNAEKALEANTADRKQLLQERLSALNAEDKAALLDRFLFIASTTSARSRGLFDLLKMESRLGQSDLVNSVKILSRLAQLFPSTISTEPTKAWDTVTASKETSPAFAIGWPNAMANGNSVDANSLPLKVAPLSWNPGRGLIASVGRKTKQTAVSCQFLVWLCDPDQRESLRSICPRVELAPEQSDRSAAKEDYRAFQAINSRDSRVEPMELSLRMANADQYRSILEESLISSLKAPDKIETIMSECATRWNQLTTKLGIDSQRITEEQSLGYRK